MNNKTSNQRRSGHGSAHILALALLLFASTVLHAATITWTGGAGGTGTDFTSGANWSGGNAPANDITTDIGSFNALTTGQPAISSARSVSGVDFATATGGWSLSGAGPLTLGTSGIGSSGQTSGTDACSVNNITVGSTSAANWNIFTAGSSANSPSTFNLSSAITLNSTAQLSLNPKRTSAGGTGVGTLNITGAISGTSAGGVKFNGGGATRNTVVITGANHSYSGPTAIVAVLLNFDQLANAGNNSSFGSSGNITLGGASSIATAAYVGSGPGQTDRLWLLDNTGANAGAITNNSSGGAISFNNTGTLVTGTAGARHLMLGGTFAASANTFAELISDMAGFTTTLAIGGNTWMISGANTHTGGTTLNTAGVLNLGNASALGGSPGVFTIGGNGSFDNTTGGPITVANPFTLSGGSPIFIGSASMTINGAVTLSAANRSITVNANTLTLGGQITGAFNLTKAGNGTLTLNNPGSADTHNGTLVSAGTLDLGGTSQTLGAVTFSGASTTQNGTITATSYSGTLGSGTAAVTANLVGSGAALTHSGSGTLALFGVNSYNGGTTIGGAGILVITNDAGLGNASASLAFTVGATGTLAVTNNAAAVNSPVTISSSRTITVNSGITANFITPDTNSLTIAAKITGAGSVIKKSSAFALGTIRFSNDASDYTGDFLAGFGNTEFTSVADQGTASSLGAGAAGTGGQITLNNASSSGTFRYVGSANSSTHRPLAWSGTTGTYALDASGSGTITFFGTSVLKTSSGNEELRLRGSNTGTNTLAHVINDLGGTTILNKLDAGTWVLAGANTFSGGVTNSSGTLQVNATETPGTSGPLGKSGTITFAGGTLQYGSANNADYSSRFSIAPNQSYKIDCNGQSVTYATSLAGAGSSLTVSSSTGSGTLTLTAASTYTGSTTVRSGTLALSGSGAIATSSAISIAAGAALDVSGVSGGYTLGTQTLYATNGATAAINGSLNLGTASLVMTNVPNAPTITVTGGTLTLASGNATTVNINNGGTPLGAGTYKLISKGTGGSVAGTAPASVTVGGNGLSGGTAAQLQITAGELFLFVCAAPTATVRTADSITNCPGASATIHADLTGVGPWNVTWSDGTVQNGVSASPAVLSVSPTATTICTISAVTDSCAGVGTASGSATVTMSAESAPVFSGALSAAASSTNLPVTIAKVKLMALASDPENDSLTLAGVATTSLQGGTVVQNGSISITYTPASDYAGADSFKYWVSDGCKLSTNTVNVTVGSGNGISPNVVYGPVIDGTDFVVRFAGIPGYTYTIEYSDSPTGPWVKKTNLTAPTDNSQGFGPGIFGFRESTLGVTTRYYRTVYPSY